LTRTNDENVARTFLCLDIPGPIKERLARLQSEVRALAAAPASWVKPANVHVTLKFLGDVPTDRIPAVSAAVRRVAGGCRPFQVTVGGTGCFPSLHRPSVLWVGIEPIPAALQTLHDDLESALAAEGFKREIKRFKPHLTIARLRTPHNARLMAEGHLKLGFAPETFTATEVIVMGINLTPTGSIYTPHSAIPFIR
jgi:RNA 2',3'-cyclic 3'-phosphodiesterase